MLVNFRVSASLTDFSTHVRNHESKEKNMENRVNINMGKTINVGHLYHMIHRDRNIFHGS